MLRIHTRSLATRLIAALVAAWFAVITSEPAMLHACPVHDGVHAAASGHATPTHQGVAHSPTHAPAPDPTAPHHCTCLGDCCAPNVVALAPRIELPSFAGLVAVADSPSTAAAVRATTPAFARPPSTGPPATTTA